MAIAGQPAKTSTARRTREKTCGIEGRREARTMEAERAEVRDIEAERLCGYAQLTAIYEDVWAYLFSSATGSC